MKYIPQVDDYVKWKDHEGWVYFKCDQTISIELGVKDKVCHEHGASFHKKNHILLVCPNFCWNELEYVKTGGRLMLTNTNRSSIDTKTHEKSMGSVEVCHRKFQ